MESTDWEKHKAEIKRIYMRKKKTLSELRNIMERDHGFRQTKAQYEKKLKQWGFQKNRMKSELWKFVGRRIAKRKREGKDSDVYIDEVLCPSAKVRKEIGRHYLSTVERYHPAPSPRTPEGIVVCSPAPAVLHQEWNPSFPWLQFMREIRLHINIYGGAMVQHPRLLDATTAHPVTGLDPATQDVVSGLKSILRRSSGAALQDTRSVPEIAALLSTIMPEEYAGQHLSIADKLFDPDDTVRLPERLIVELFLLSNNFMTPDFLLKNSMEVHDKQIMEMFRQSGLKDLAHFKQLLSMPEVTAEAVAEKLFASAMRSGDLKTTQMMLEAGMNPDALIRIPDLIDPTTPLVVAASFENSKLSLDMTRLLLSYNAQVNRKESQVSPLYCAIRRTHKTVVELLLDYGAHASPLCLACVIQSGNITITQILLDAGVDINARLPQILWPKRDWDIDLPLPPQVVSPSGATALGLAITRKHLQMVQTLLARGAETNALNLIDNPKSEFCGSWTTALGLAAMEGMSWEMSWETRITAFTTAVHYVSWVKVLLEAPMKPRFNVPEKLHVPALVLAVDKGYFGAVELLLNAGADIHSADTTGIHTLVERAVKGGNLGLCRTLLASGAMVNRPSSESQRESCSALVIAIRQRGVQLVRLLLEYGARADDILNQPTETALGEAIQVGSWEIIQMLQKAGATRAGKGICCIANIETARYLQQAGLLRSILQENGQRILTAAILHGGSDLVHYLLNFNIDQQNDDNVPSQVTALEAATFRGNLELVKCLISRGAGITEAVLNAAVWRARTNDGIILHLLRGASPFGISAPNAINMAVQYCNHYLAQILLDSGIDPTGLVLSQVEQNFAGLFACWRFGDGQATKESVLETAAEKCDRRMLQILLTATDWGSKYTGRALTVALLFEKYDLVQDLLGAGADVNQEVTENAGSRWVSTPLLAAVKNNQIAFAQTLLQAGADINYLTLVPGGRTPLQQAVENGNLKLVNFILEAGADVNGPPAPEGGGTALQLGAIYGYLEIVRILLNAGANVNAQRARLHGRSALEGAAETGRLDMLHLLLSEGASLKGHGRRQYVRAVKFAETSGHYAAAKFLKSHGSWTELDSIQYDKEDFQLPYVVEEVASDKEDERME